MIRILDSSACEATVELLLTYINIKIENITPNGDGINDYWYPEQNKWKPK